MNVFAIILLIALSCFVTWLIIDTIIALIRRYKYKKKSKDQIIDTNNENKVD